jgi:Protein of unknown function (DUF2637)
VTAADQVIRWSTASVVVGVAAVAAVASYEHAYALIRAHGEVGWSGRLVPLTVDGLIYASSMVMLNSARRRVAVPPLARWLLGLGIAATLAANVAHGLGHGPSVPWWLHGLPSCWSVRGVRGTAAGSGTSGDPGDDSLQAQAAKAFAGEVTAGRVPSVRVIRSRLHVGQPRKQRVRAYLTALIRAHRTNAGSRSSPHVHSRSPTRREAAKSQKRNVEPNQRGCALSNQFSRIAISATGRAVDAI